MNVTPASKRLYRVIAYLRADNDAVIAEQSGDEVVSGRDREHMVRMDSGHCFKRTAEWVPTREAAIRAAIVDMEKAAASAQAAIADLRNRLLSVDVVPLADAIKAVQTAATMFDASAVRNEVATQASRGLRPESDADAVRDAYFERWDAELKRPQLADASKERLHWTGD